MCVVGVKALHNRYLVSDLIPCIFHLMRNTISVKNVDNMVHRVRGGHFNSAYCSYHECNSAWTSIADLYYCAG